MGRPKTLVAFLLLVVLGWFAVDRPAAADLGSARRRWQELQLREAETLAPKLHKRAVREMSLVERAASKGDTSEMQKRLERAEKLLDELEEAVTIARTVWSDMLRSRSRAREAGADTAATAAWQRAENTLLAAAKKLETGRRSAAVRQAEPLGALYEQSRMEAVRFALVGHTRALLLEAEERNASRYAPRSFVRALDAVARVEKLLEARGEADAQVEDEAARAAREARHALYLLERIQGACREETRERTEAVVLEWEAALQRVLHRLGLRSSFENGMGQPLQRVQVETDRLLRERNRLRIELAQRSDQVDSLRHVIHELRLHVHDFEGKLAELTPFREEANILVAIQNLFTQSEGRVLIENRDLILRLHGLRFASGESELPSENLMILDKVVEAVRARPGSYLIIEGHTDSSGREEANMRLSQERANAVRDYLVEEAGIDAGRVTAIGYGATRPVASNDTEEGRTLNRRIEITVSRPG
ncbi:MAG: OmpA family protein [Candidatus Krumholzibacteriia bacterium]